MLDCVGTLVASDISSLTDCVGTVTGSTAGALLSTNDSGTCTQFGINAGALDYLNQSACAGLDCVGTVIASDLTGLDQSACPGLDCVGDITGVFSSAGLSGTAFAGDVTLGIDSGTLTPFDQSACPGLDCVGTITGITIGDGLDNSGTATAPNIAVDSTVVRTTGAQDVTGMKTFTNGITVDGCIVHCGDANTCITFGTDAMNFVVGGLNMIKLDENGQDHVILNSGNNNVDLRVKGSTSDHSFFVAASSEHVGIGTDIPTHPLHVIGASNTTGQILSAGTDLFDIFCDEAGAGGGIGEAPEDSNYYGRRNAGWAVMGGALCEGTVGGTGTNNYIPAWCSSTGITNSKLRQTFTQVVAGATLSATGGFETSGQILSAGQDLHALLGGGGGGGVDSVTAGDANITIGGTATNPTIAVTSGCFGTVTSITSSDSSMLIGSGTSDACIQIASACQTAWNGTYTTVQSNSATWAPPALFNVVDDGATGKLTTNSFADIDTIWDTPSVLDTSGYSWNSATGALTVLKTGNLMITLKVVTWNNLNNRHQLVIRINKNGTFMVGDSQYASRNNTQDEGGAYIPNFMMPVAANDVITFQAKDVGVAATMGGSTQVSKMTYASAVLYPS